MTTDPLARGEGKIFAWYIVINILLVLAVIFGWITWELNAFNQYYDPIPWDTRLRYTGTSTLLYTALLSPLVFLIGWLHWQIWLRLMLYHHGAKLVCCSALITVIIFTVIAGGSMNAFYLYVSNGYFDIKMLWWFPGFGAIGLLACSITLPIYLFSIRPQYYRRYSYNIQ